MSELFLEAPMFTEEEKSIIEAERAKVTLNDPTLEVTDERLLQMHKIVQAAAQIGSNATIESDGN